MKKFKLSEIQSNAILDMRLSNIAQLEQLKIEDELKEKQKIIKALTALLKSNKKILDIIKEELAEMKKKYGDERRTRIVANELGSFSQEDLIPNDPTIVILTKDGYIKRLPPEVFKTQGRGGKGVTGLTTKEEDTVDQIIATTTIINLLFFTTKGRVFQLKTYEVPQTTRTARGQAVQNFLNLGPEEHVSTIISVKDLQKYSYLMMLTKQGVIKKVAIEAFASVKRSGLIAIKLKGDDSLQWIKPSGGKDQVILTTALGQAIRFEETDIRPMGRTAAGVRGVRLKGDDEVIGMDVILRPGAKWLVVSKRGYGKLSLTSSYKIQKRGGTGVKTSKITKKTGKITNAFLIDEHHLPEGASGDLLIISSKGQVIRLPIKSLSTQGRVTQGTRLMRFKNPEDEVASITII